MYDDIERGGVGRGWNQFSLISQSSLGSRKSRSLGVSSLSVPVPLCGGRVPVCGSVPHCRRVCPSVGGCVPVREGLPKRGKVCPTVGGCVPVREGLPKRGKVCPTVGRCVPVCEGVSQYGCVCCSMGGCVPVREGLPQRRTVGGMCMCVCMCLCHMCSWGGEECVQVYMCMSVIVTCSYLCINM